MDLGEHVRPLAGHGAPLRSLAMVEPPDGRSLLVTVGYENDVKVWDLATGEFLRAPRIHSYQVTAPAAVVLPDGRAVAVTKAYSGAVLLWDLLEGRLLDPAPILPGDLSAAAVSGTGMALGHGSDIASYVWNRTGGLDAPTDGSGRDL
ncbi:WD40 repeat domain-containing protein [Streptomyces sp. NBC_00249]|uniref:WD40 repeat domain-containing protein n=1 Tax=Streptomyces sp. NBC_00249 TaxID=2975690 RepID=UPI0022530474|nr:WD40 repeat domain-containing protein [Streptomyces sp. NBC_00249]MCX5197399.1 WD40 repeat domain-containing protein [Streptomyces sp. NBC_00249]